MYNNVTQLWLGKTQPHKLAIARILFGSFLLAFLMLYAPHSNHLFSANGFIVTFTSRWGLLTAAPSVPIAILLYVITCSAALSFIIGWHFRIASAVLVIVSMHYYNLHFHLIDGTPFRLLWFTLLLFSISGAHKAYSVVANQHPATVINVLPVTLLKIQVSVLYIVSGGLKMLLPAWQSGDILYYVLHGNLATPIGQSLGNSTLITDYSHVVVWLIILAELYIGIGLWRKSTKIAAMIMGCIFHITVAITISLWWFLFIPCLYVLFFDAPSSKSVSVLK